MSKLITSLLVVELRTELEKRGLDKNGVKQVLMERLEKAITEEGLDPETYLFETGDKKIGKRLSTSSQADQEQPPEKQDDEEEDAGKDTENEEKLTANTGSKQSSNKKDNTDIGGLKPSAVISAEEIQDKENGGESPIRLTLEEEENLHDDETENTPEVTDDKEKKDENTNDQESKAFSDKTATENDTKKDQETSDQGNKQPVKKRGNSSSNPRILWISNVTKSTRASDIKQALSAHGKVVGAKVVVNAKFPGSLCFGYVTMSSAEDANNVIAKLNNTELNGQIIKIEKFDNVRTEQLGHNKLPQKVPEGGEKSATAKPIDKANENKDKSANRTEKGSINQDDKNKDSKESDKKKQHADKSESDEKKAHNSTHQSRDKKRTQSNESQHRSLSGGKNDVLTFDKIREERERQRWREKERLLREEARRRHEEAIRHREIERKQRSEAQRLEREREKLRMERERIEKEKAELIRLERERQKAERERLELEKLELERTRLRLEEDRRATKRPSSSYKIEDSLEHKKVVSDRHFIKTSPLPHIDSLSSRKVRDYEPPPPKKYSSSKDYKDRLSFDKHDSYPEKRRSNYVIERSVSSLNRSSTGSTLKYEKPYDSRDVRDMRPHEPPSILLRPPKESRYSLPERERDRSPHFHRDDRRIISDEKRDMPPGREHRFQEVPRYERNSSDWPHPPSSANKSFGGSFPKHYPKESWRPDTSGNPNRWGGPGAPSGKLPGHFSGNSSLNMSPTCPPPPGINNYPDRFEYSRSASNGMRKY